MPGCCSPQSLLNRYRAGGRRPAGAALERQLREPMSFVAATYCGTIVGVAVASADPRHGQDAADVGLLVEDAWQGRHLGRELMSHVAGASVIVGYTQLIAYPTPTPGTAKTPPTSATPGSFPSRLARTRIRTCPTWWCWGSARHASASRAGAPGPPVLPDSAKRTPASAKCLLLPRSRTVWMPNASLSSSASLSVTPASADGGALRISSSVLSSCALSKPLLRFTDTGAVHIASSRAKCVP